MRVQPKKVRIEKKNKKDNKDKVVKDIADFCIDNIPFLGGAVGDALYKGIQEAFSPNRKNIKEDVEKVTSSLIAIFRNLENILKNELKNGCIDIANVNISCAYVNRKYILFNKLESMTTQRNYHTKNANTYFPEYEKLTIPNKGELDFINKEYKKRLNFDNDFNFIAMEDGSKIYRNFSKKWEIIDWHDFSACSTYVLRPNVSSIKELIFYLITNNLIPEVIYGKDLYEKEIKCINYFKDALNVSENRIAISTKKIEEKAKKDNISFNKIKDTLFEVEKLIKKNPVIENNREEAVPSNKDKVKEEKLEKNAAYYLSTETRRCDLDAYSPSLLSENDNKAGLWELWTSEEKDTFTLEDGTTLPARNPCKDINEGIIAIDFGTTSTIVVRTVNGVSRKLLSLGKEDEYENPTMIQFLSLENFMKAYKEKEHRPETQWKDLQVAFSVASRIKEGFRADYPSIMTQLKQWASDDTKDTLIKPINDKEVLKLSSISDALENGEVNPLEIYAYYLGLYINNQFTNHGVYLKYYMSFPARFSTDNIENIKESFKRGIEKSIPEAIFKDPRNKVEIDMIVSEPEAYATCALQEFGFRPENEKGINYAIYDFGGGTTDYAYGLWKYDEDEKRNAIQNIAVDGDRYLGGEYLLRALAFNVFSSPSNLQVLDEKNCKFYYGIPDQRKSDVRGKYLSNLLPAQINMQVMVNALREYWENSAETLFNNFNNYSDAKEVNEGKNKKMVDFLQYADSLNTYSIKSKKYIITPKIMEKYLEQNINHDVITFNISLVPEGSVISSPIPVTLKYSKKEIYEYIKKHINDGIEGFFDKLNDVFFDNQVIKENNEVINIFLAGNSSKSPIFVSLIENAIEDRVKMVKERYNIDVTLKLYAPLGSELAFDQLKQNYLDMGIDESKVSERIKKLQKERSNITGKTGLAYGIVTHALQDVKIIKKQNTDIFNYYLGLEGEGEFNEKIFVPIDFKDTPETGKPVLGRWYKAIPIIAGKTRYNLLDTTKSKCIDADMEITEAHGTIITIPQADEGSFIYINAKSINEISYIVAKEGEDLSMKIRNWTKDDIIKHRIVLKQ